MSYTNPTIAPSGITFAQWKAGGPSQHLEMSITANSTPTVAPTVAPTLAASGSGATLPAATYWVAVSETNGIGETLLGPASASQAVTLGQNLVVTFQSLKSGNSARNTYTSTVGSTGPFTLAATGTTASTLTISAPLPSNSYAVAPPTTNTTALTSNMKLQLARYVKTNQGQKLWDFYHRLVTEFNRGQPMKYSDVVTKHRDAHVVFAVLSTMAAESGALLDSNPGTLTLAMEPIGTTKVKRVWP